MEYKTYKITTGTLDSLTTELMFDIAVEKVSGRRLVLFNIAPDDTEERRSKTRIAVIKILKKLKKQGRIELFATPDDFLQSTTEAKYLLNKYPGLSENNGEIAIIV